MMTVNYKQLLATVYNTILIHLVLLHIFLKIN